MIPRQSLTLLFVLLLLAFSSPGALAQGPLAPDGVPGELYYAPFPLQVALDGDLSDWEGVPRVTIPFDAPPDGTVSAVTFAGAADDSFLYFMADVRDERIITGQHGEEFWNEDSVEFYVNATGDLVRRDYVDGVAQVTIPPLNIGGDPDTPVLGGIRGTTVDARAVVVPTATGWAVEAALPLVNAVWEIVPVHGGTLGFQMHLNGASSADRDTKLIWSLADTADQSYLYPDLFGRLVFYAIGASDIPPTPTPVPVAAVEVAAADAPYRDPALPVETRVEDLLARMTLAEKIGQMTLIEKNSLRPADVTAQALGGVLSGGGGYPAGDNSPAGWAAMVEDFQQAALASRLGIPLIYGVDAVHGHNNLRGAVIFPHNIGLGAANNPPLVEAIGRATAREVAATGIVWNYAPVLAVARDIRWGRTYESFSENTDLVTALATAYLRGLQGSDLTAPDSVLGTLKHFVGDGGTAWGSATGEARIDRGVTDVDEATLRAVHLAPYIAGIEAGARTVMVSFSTWGGLNMHAQRHLITDVLKGELGFTGFVVSDWGGVDLVVPGDTNASVVAAINAGIDMNMVPYDAAGFIETLTRAVEAGDVPLERIDDAVRRILRVKLEAGLFERPAGGNAALLAAVGGEEHRALARQAVRESLVLLRNEDDRLPLSKDTPVIVVGGEAANNIGIQSGGWTIEWQGGDGAITPGTTILEGIQAAVGPDSAVYFDRFGRLDRIRTANGTPLQPDVCIAVVGERPYAEWFGDSPDLALPDSDLAVLDRLVEGCPSVVAIVISGRPVILTDYADDLDAIVAAWLPGTEGAGVADVLFGTAPFTGHLPFTWPRDADQLPFDFEAMPEGAAGPLYPFGYGLTTGAR